MLNIALQTAKARTFDCADEIIKLQQIILVLEMAKKHFEEGNQKELLQNLKKFSELIGEMKLRRGSIALQHREIAWKQLGFLLHAIQNIEFSNDKESYALLLNHYKPEEIDNLKEKFEELLAQEKEQLYYAEKIATVLEYQNAQLVELRVKKKLIKEATSTYTKLVSLIDSIIRLEQQPEDTEEFLSKKSEKLATLNKLLEGLANKPEYILISTLFQEAFGQKIIKINLNQFQSIQEKIKKQKDFLLEKLKLYKTKEREILEGRIISPINFSRDLISIKQQLDDIIYFIDNIEVINKREKSTEELIQLINAKFKEDIIRLIESGTLRIKSNNKEIFIKALKEKGLSEEQLLNFSLSSSVIMKELVIFYEKSVFDIYKRLQTNCMLFYINYNYYASHIPENYIKIFNKFFILVEEEPIFEINFNKINSLKIVINDSISKINKDNYNKGILEIIYENLARIDEIITKCTVKQTAGKKTARSKEEKTPGQLLQETIEDLKILCNEIREDIELSKSVMGYILQLSHINLQNKEDTEIQKISEIKEKFQLLCNPKAYYIKILNQIKDLCANPDKLTEKNIKTTVELLIKLAYKLDSVEFDDILQLKDRFSVENISSVSQLLNMLVTKHLFRLEKDTIPLDRIEIMLTEIKKAEITEELHASKTASPYLVAFIKYQLDIENINFIIKNIARLNKLFTDIDLGNELSCIALRRAFFKILLVIGECAHDITKSTIQKYTEIPWYIFNELRNIIYHYCMDIKVGRDRFNRILLGHDSSINIQLMQNCVIELNQLVKELNTIKQELQQNPIIEIKPLATPKKEKAKPDDLLKTIKCIIGEDENETKQVNRKTINKLITISLLCESLLKTESNVTTNIVIHQEAADSEEKRLIKESPVSIISDFIIELQHLLTIKDLNINEAKELSLAFCGQLARLLVDGSDSFIYSSPKELLEELETLIIERGNLAHNSVVRKYQVRDNTYVTMVTTVQPLLSLAKLMLNIRGCNPDSFTEQCEILIGKFNNTKKVFLSLKDKYIHIEEIKQASDIFKYPFKKLLDLRELRTDLPALQQTIDEANQGVVSLFKIIETIKQLKKELLKLLETQGANFERTTYLSLLQTIEILFDEKEFPELTFFESYQKKATMQYKELEKYVNSNILENIKVCFRDNNIIVILDDYDAIQKLKSFNDKAVIVKKDNRNTNKKSLDSRVQLIDPKRNKRFKEIFNKGENIILYLSEHLNNGEIKRFIINLDSEIQTMHADMLSLKQELILLQHEFNSILLALEKILNIKIDLEKAKENPEILKRFFKELGELYESNLDKKYGDAEHFCQVSFYKDYCKAKIVNYLTELAARYNELIEFEANLTKAEKNLGEFFKLLNSLKQKFMQASAEVSDHRDQLDPHDLVLPISNTATISPITGAYNLYQHEEVADTEQEIETAIHINLQDAEEYEQNKAAYLEILNKLVSTEDPQFIEYAVKIIIKYIIHDERLINVAGLHGATALHLAAFLNHKNLALFLLEKHANTTIQDNRKNLPHQVWRDDQNQVAELIKESYEKQVRISSLLSTSTTSSTQDLHNSFFKSPAVQKSTLSECYLYLMSSLPNNSDLAKYANCYILLTNSNELYSVKTDKAVEEVKIKDFEKLLMDISHINSEQSEKIPLSSQKIHEIIELNTVLDQGINFSQ